MFFCVTSFVYLAYNLDQKFWMRIGIKHVKFIITWGILITTTEKKANTVVSGEDQGVEIFMISQVFQNCP